MNLRYIVFSVLLIFLNCEILTYVKGQCLSADDDLSLAADTNLLRIQDFSIDLFKRLIPNEPDQSFIFSPYSVWNALILAYFGSAGTTEDQFKSVLKVGDKISALRKWRQLEMLYRMREDTTVNNTFVLSNKIYFDENVRLRLCMQDILHNEIQQLDFMENPDVSANIINQFVFETTRGHIKQMVTASDVRYAYLVLVNAAYFKGNWKLTFNPNNTGSDTFYTHSKQEIQVPMMYQYSLFRYGYDDQLKFEVLELPYSGDKIAMYIFLPYKGDELSLLDVVRGLNSQKIEEMVGNMYQTQVHLYLPKFAIETVVEEKLIQALYGLGLKDPFFSFKANFVDFSFNPNLKLDHSIHKAFIEVNEKGTVAGAATAFIANKIGGYSEFRCDRPFVFAIRDNLTKNILFMGTYKKPENTETASQGPVVPDHEPAVKV